METLKGTLEALTYMNEETGFVVASVREEGTRYGEAVKVVGNLAAVNVGEPLRMEGYWVRHPEYGRQFRVVTYEATSPGTLDGMEKYLGSGLVKGVGPVLATRIVAQFGMDALDVIEHRPERLTEVVGIGHMRAERIAKAWQEQRRIRDVMLFLQSYGVGAGLCVRIYRQYGDAAIALIRENPFRLAEEVWGIGFRTADKIAERLGVPREAPARLCAGIEYTLSRKADEGHTYVPTDELLAAAAELLDVSVESLAPALASLNSRQRVLVEEGRVYLAACYYSEIGVAGRIRALLGTPPIPRSGSAVERALSDAEGSLGITFAESQRRAIAAALETAVVVLTGGPGTGKTTTVRGILALFQRLGRRVALAAPTGRAAKRLAEVTGGDAKTIHRLLGFSPKDGAFAFDADNPIEVDALIVDEVSMVDVVLLNALLRAVPAGAHVVLVGDVDQLPPVGAGNALRDIIESGSVPVVALTELFRQARDSLIVTNAHRINRGETLVLGGPSDRDFFFVDEDDPDAACETVVELCTSRLPRYYGFDPFASLQVIAPMRRGVLGTEHLNERLQDALNADGQPIAHGGRRLRVGDKVMQIVNNYEEDVFNGDIGRIADVDAVEGTLRVEFGDKQVDYDLTNLSELALAYCVTVHKAQGSEYPAVVLPLHTQHYLLLQRNLLYTAVTRARRLVVIVGSRRAMAIAIRNDRVARRYTSLAERLRTPRR
jgi:exodeoxyribonuclease V alpha subunit